MSSDSEEDDTFFDLAKKKLSWGSPGTLASSLIAIPYNLAPAKIQTSLYIFVPVIFCLVGSAGVVSDSDLPLDRSTSVVDSIAYLRGAWLCILVKHLCPSDAIQCLQKKIFIFKIL